MCPLPIYLWNVSLTETTCPLCRRRTCIDIRLHVNEVILLLNQTALPYKQKLIKGMIPLFIYGTIMLQARCFSVSLTWC